MDIIFGKTPVSENDFLFKKIESNNFVPDIIFGKQILSSILPSNYYSLTQKLYEAWEEGATWPSNLACDASGSILIAGVPDDGGYYGYAYLYVFFSGEYVPLSQYNYVSDWWLNQNSQRFGQQIKLSRDSEVLMVSAPGTNNNEGQVLMYVGDNYPDENISIPNSPIGIPFQRLEGLPPRIGTQYGFPPGELFGFSIDMNYDASVLFVGSIWDMNYKGSISIFTGDRYNGWNITQVLTGKNIPGQIVVGLGNDTFCNYSGNLLGGIYNIYGFLEIYSGYNNNWSKIKTIDNSISGLASVWPNNFGKFAQNGNILFFNTYYTFGNSGNFLIYTGLNTWNLKQTISYTGSSATATSNLDGSIIAIGYPEFSIPNSPAMGKVDIYTGNPLDGWNIFQSISGDYPNYAIGTETSGDGFGSCIAMTDDGSKLFVGAPYDGISNSGACFIYKLNIQNTNSSLQTLINFGGALGEDNASLISNYGGTFYNESVIVNQTDDYTEFLGHLNYFYPSSPENFLFYPNVEKNFSNVQNFGLRTAVLDSGINPPISTSPYIPAPEGLAINLIFEMQNGNGDILRTYSGCVSGVGPNPSIINLTLINTYGNLDNVAAINIVPKSRHIGIEWIIYDLVKIN